MKNLKLITYLCAVMLLLSFSVNKNTNEVDVHQTDSQKQTVSILVQFPSESSLDDRQKFRNAFSSLFGFITVEKCFGSDDSEVWLVPNLSQIDFTMIYNTIVAELNNPGKTTGDRKRGDTWKETTKGFTMTYGGQCN